MTNQPTWIGRTELVELLEDGETTIAGETFELTESAKAELNRRMGDEGGSDQ